MNEGFPEKACCVRWPSEGRGLKQAIFKEFILVCYEIFYNFQQMKGLINFFQKSVE